MARVTKSEVDVSMNDDGDFVVTVPKKFARKVGLEEAFGVDFVAENDILEYLREGADDNYASDTDIGAFLVSF